MMNKWLSKPRFRGRRVLRQVNVNFVQIPPAKEDFFGRILEASLWTLRLM